MAGRSDKTRKIFLRKGDIVYYKHDSSKKYECCQDEFRGYIPIILKGEKYKPNWDGTFDGDRRIEFTYSDVLEREKELTKSEKRRKLLDDILIEEDSGFFKNFLKKIKINK